MSDDARGWRNMSQMWGIVFAFCQTILWAGTSIVIRGLSTRMDPLLVGGGRAAIALLVVLPLVALTGKWVDYRYLTTLQLAYLWGSVIIAGVIGDAFYTISLRTLGFSRAFPIANCYPLFTVLTSIVILGEPASIETFAGLALVLLGVYSIARPKKHIGLESQETLPRRQLITGVLLALGTAIFWGIGAVILALGLRNMDSIVANSVRIPIVVLVAFLISLGRGTLPSLKRLDRRTLGLLALGGVLGWAIGGTLFTAAVQLAGPSKTAIIGATGPLFGMPLSMLLLKERPSRYALVGTVLTVAGIILVV